MAHDFLFTDQVSTITTFIMRLINQAGFVMGLSDPQKQAIKQENLRFIAMWEMTLQNAPESTWPWVTQNSCGLVGLYAGADFLLGLRRLQ